MPLRPTVVVLAAGRGRRSNAPSKPLQRLGAGSVLASAVRHAIQTDWPVAVVATEQLAPQIARWVATRDLVVLREDEAALGVGHAIAAAVSAHAGADGWLLMPGDMPLVRPDSIRAVGDALQAHPITFAQHQGRRGHPVGFASEMYSELAALTADDGARRLLARYPAFGVELGDPGVLIDVDNEAALDAARSDA